MITPRGSAAIAARTLLAPIAWGTTYVTITELLPDGRPLFVALMRLAPAGVLLAGIGWMRSRWVPDGPEWRRLAASAMFNFGVFFPLMIVAVYRLPGGVAAALGGAQPLLVGVITASVAGTRMLRRDVVIGVIAALGVALVVVRPGAGIDPPGVLAALGANLAFACGTVTAKLAAPPPDRIAATGYQMLIAAVVLAPLMSAVEGAPPSMTGASAIGFAYLGLGATGAAFLLWFAGIPRLPTAAPPVLGLAAPLTGAVLGWLVLGQALTAVQITGMAITCGAIAHTALAGGVSLRAHERRDGSVAGGGGADPRGGVAGRAARGGHCRSGAGR